MNNKRFTTFPIKKVLNRSIFINYIKYISDIMDYINSLFLKNAKRAKKSRAQTTNPRIQNNFKKTLKKLLQRETNHS